MSERQTGRKLAIAAGLALSAVTALASNGNDGQSSARTEVSRPHVDYVSINGSEYARFPGIAIPARLDYYEANRTGAIQERSSDVLIAGHRIYVPDSPFAMNKPFNAVHLNPRDMSNPQLLEVNETRLVEFPPMLTGRENLINCNSFTRDPHGVYAQHTNALDKSFPIGFIFGPQDEAPFAKTIGAANNEPLSLCMVSIDPPQTPGKAPNIKLIIAAHTDNGMMLQGAPRFNTRLVVPSSSQLFLWDVDKLLL